MDLALLVMMPETRRENFIVVMTVADQIQCLYSRGHSPTRSARYTVAFYLLRSCWIECCSILHEIFANKCGVLVYITAIS